MQIRTRGVKKKSTEVKRESGINELKMTQKRQASSWARSMKSFSPLKTIREVRSVEERERRKNKGEFKRGGL